MAVKPVELVLADPSFLDDAVWRAIQNIANELLKDMRSSSRVPSKTGDYQESLSKVTDKKNRTVTIFEKSKSGNKKRKIAHFLENGTLKMGAQEHWKYFEDKYRPKVQEAIIIEINKELN